MLRILVSIFVARISIFGSSQKYHINVKKEVLKSSPFDLIIDVVYGHDFRLALTYDVYLPASPKGAGVILIKSGGWKSPYDTFKVQEGDGYRFARNEEMF
jgi:hypothetical protein